MSKQGKRFAFVQLSDTSGVFEVVLFSETLARHRDLLDASHPLLLSVDGRIENDEVKLLVNDIEPLDQAVAQAQAGMRIYLHDPTPLASIRSLLEREKKGRGRVTLVLDLAGEGEVELSLAEGFRLSPAARQAIKAVPGVMVEDL